MTKAVTQVQQIQKQCKEVSTRETCYPITKGESKTVLYREQCHNITKEVDGLLNIVPEETKEPASALKLTDRHDEKVECKDLTSKECKHMIMEHWL